MSLSLALGAALVLAGLTSPAFAQQDFKSPAPSPKAMTMQAVGVTEITIEYSSPGVKGRKIFGKKKDDALVPYGELWRTGANAPTKLTVSTDVMIDGKEVPAGSYAMLTIPGKKEWTIILSGDDKARVRTYDQKKDLLRLTVTPEKVKQTRERLAFSFVNTTDDTTRLDLRWDKVRVSIPIKTMTQDLTVAGIEKFSNWSARRHASAARYYKGKVKDMAKADAHAQVAAAIDGSSWYIHWVAADVRGAMGDSAKACEHALKAWDLGLKDDYFWGKDRVEKQVKDWGCKG